MPRPGSIDRRQLLLASPLLLTGCGKPPAFQGVDLTGVNYARELALDDQFGRARKLADFRGKVLVVFFGYTQCPDVCPTTLGELKLVREQLGKDGARVQPLFVTVDPERDTPALLKDYMASFGADMLALRGTPEQTRQVAQDFHVFYAKVPSKSGEGYSMDHTAASFLFDAQGRVRVYLPTKLGPTALLNDLKQLLAEGA